MSLSLSFNKKQSRKVFSIGILLFLGVLFGVGHVNTVGESLSGDVIPQFVTHLDRLNWFASFKNVQCHVVYYKDESDMDIKKCVESIYFYKQNYIANVFGVFGVQVVFVNIPDALLARTNIRDELVSFLSNTNNNPILLFVIHRAEFFSDVSGISFIVR